MWLTLPVCTVGCYELLDARDYHGLGAATERGTPQYDGTCMACLEANCATELEACERRSRMRLSARRDRPCVAWREDVDRRDGETSAVVVTTRPNIAGMNMLVLVPNTFLQAKGEEQ